MAISAAAIMLAASPWLAEGMARVLTPLLGRSGLRLVRLGRRPEYTPWLCSICSSINPAEAEFCDRGCGRRAEVAATRPASGIGEVHGTPDTPARLDDATDAVTDESRMRPETPGRQRGGRSMRRG